MALTCSFARKSIVCSIPRSPWRAGDHAPPNGARPAGRTATIIHPAGHLLGQAQLLLRAAHATQVGAYRRGWPPRLDQAERGRLALSLVAITTLAELHVFPDNLLPCGHQPDSQLARRMEHANVRLRQARTHLETLASWAGLAPRHCVLIAVAGAVDVMGVGPHPQDAGGYHHLRHVDRTSAQLGYVVASLADIASAEQEHDQQWKPAAGLLSIASHALHHIHQVGDLL